MLPVQLVTKGDWIVAKALHQQDGPQLARWAPSDVILVATKKARSWEQLECLVLAAISLCALGLLGEAIAAKKSDKGELVFEGNKKCLGTHTYEVGPWPRRWLQFLSKIRTHKGYAQERPATKLRRR